MATEGIEAMAGAAGEYVDFRSAGDNAKGDYRCAECEHGITVHSALPACPKCSGRVWEQTAWSPFSRAATD